MPLVSELDLPYLAIQDAGFAADPLPLFAAARQQHPWLARSDFGYLVHEYEAIRDLTWMDDKFNPSLDAVIDLMNAKGTPWGEFMDGLMLSKDPPEHTRLRNSVAASFTPRTANRMRPLMREVVSGLLDEWLPKGRFDFCEFASHFPIRVMFGLIGVSTEWLPGIRASLETQGLSASLDKSLLPALEDAYRTLWAFVDSIIIERQRDGGGDDDDVLNRLIAARQAGELDDTELRNMLIFLFAAGYDTSKNMLTLIMHVMMQHPAQWARCATDRAFCDKVVEEVFRYHSVSNIYRTARVDIHYRDVVIPAGTILMLTLTVASRDPQAFADADEFQPERRDPNRHIAFGRGVHICLGQHLARAQIQEGVHLIAQRLRDPRIDGPLTWRPFPGVWGIKSLPVAFTPETGRRTGTQTGPAGETSGCPPRGKHGCLTRRPLVDFGLKDATVFISGGTKGLGRAAAIAFACEGACVAVGARDRQGLLDTVEALREAGAPDAFGIRLDVAECASIDAAFAEITERWGRLNTLINMAGPTDPSQGLNFLEVPDAQWQRYFDIGIMSIVRCTRAAVPLMAKAGWGRVINISSVSARLGLPMEAPYMTAKAGLNAISRNMASVLAPRGILVNTVTPGVFRTEALRFFMEETGASATYDPDDLAQVWNWMHEVNGGRHAGIIGRVALPGEIASLLLLLGSPANTYIAGANIPIDGGSDFSIA